MRLSSPGDMPNHTRDLNDPFAFSRLRMTDSAYLASQTHWIRNTLDPVIARSGPEALSVNDVLNLDAFLRNLIHASGISLAHLRVSRIHLAILEICGRATRWPKKLIERAEAIESVWEEKFGPLKEIRWNIFDEGGRLENWKGCEGLDREEIVLKWMRDPDVRVGPGRARKWGDLGFKAGDWWINSLFAYRAGIVDSGDPRGGIVADSKGAYAVLMTSTDEVWNETPEQFTYRSREGDKGRYRLTAATIDSRQPVRILRSHTLRCFWSPKAGVRYDGLYKVVSWSISSSPQTGTSVYNITFTRLPSEPCMEVVLSRPWAEEVEDYKEYKRLRREARSRREENMKSAKDSKPGMVVTGSDGTDDRALPERGHPFRDSAVKVGEAIEVHEDETADPTSSDSTISVVPCARSGDRKVLRDITP